MDVLEKLSKALEEVQETLLDYNMSLKWELKIEHFKHGKLRDELKALEKEKSFDDRT